jgi:hypothetical protein
VKATPLCPPQGNERDGQEHRKHRSPPAAPTIVRLVDELVFIKSPQLLVDLL